ncbi:MAG: indolepyruvate/phenylpyruvate decarboxylase [Rhodobacteraceae bacterium]|nr:indolepyruvate/phenylpyruvate decarboxylase [Paracoccaceae bacterium]
MSKQPLAHVLLNALKAYGAAEIFGIPGDFALPFFKEIDATKTLPLHTLSHEPGVGFAADAAARMRSSLSVAAVTYGAGGLNMINPTAQAYAEKSPVVVISGAPGKEEGAMGLGLHHQVKHLDSQLLIYQEVTCAQAVLNDAETAPAEIARVLTAARVQSRPVYIEFPRDMVHAPASPVPGFTPPPANHDAAATAAHETLTALKAAKKPALLVGVEIRRFGLEDKVAQLARKLRLPVATSFMGRGLLSDADAPLIGAYLGLAGDAPTREVIEGADRLLMLGVILCDTNFGVSTQQIDRLRMIHAFDRQVRFGHHLYPEIGLAEYLDALLAIAEPIAAAAPSAPAPYPNGLQADDHPLEPMDVARALNDLFAKKGPMPIASDMGDCLFTAMDVAPTALVAPAYYATMGAGAPMGIGLELASGRRPLILVGDGAFQMTGWELGNAPRLGITPIVLLFNNRAWGMLKAFQPGPAYNDLDEWRFADLADRLGGVGERAATGAELKSALDRAVADEANWRLIEIMLPSDRYSGVLTRFANTIKQRSALARG